MSSFMSPQETKTQLLGLLKAHFGYESFRPGQELAMDSVIAGRDTLVVMPTGGGKSLIYQLPALILDGITLVVSPLISLMKDQVDSLAKVGIPATYINSALSPQETEARLEEIKKGKYKLVYIAPERFYNLEFVRALGEIKVSLFAIDEAHCISQWGHDFRPSYLRLKDAVKLVGRPPLLALTATATPEVRQDIVKQSAMVNPELVVTGFSRPNLQFGVLPANDSAKVEIIMQTIESLSEKSGIIYVGTRAKSDELLAIL
ncbi:MAG TPA: RecQ family ATP-dependent DNA helicase, partial [bacterium]|nr:RecQ family ATP-dependent DNA helicase [bacterium]